jgi:RNA polymerase sigma-70 factor (sigma-E family)
VPVTESEFTEFVRARGPALQRTAYLLVGDWRTAEDLLQTALTKTYPHWRRVRDGNPEAYVRAVLANTYASWWRRKWRGEVPHEALPDRVGDDRWADVDTREALRTALDRLPRKMRAVVVLRFHEDMSVDEVARALGVSAGTVKSQTAKALAKLRADAGLTGLAVAGKET